MRSISFQIKVRHGRKEFTGHCDKFCVGENPQIRVWYVESGKEQVITFYELNEVKQKYFWFPLPEPRNTIAKSIAAALVKSIKARKVVEPNA